MRVIGAFTFILFVQTGFTQISDNIGRHNDKNIYWQALKHYLDFIATDTFYLKSKRIDTLYVYKDTKTTDSLLNRIGATELVMIEDPYAFITKRNGKGITLYSIFPIDFENGEFWVSFVPFNVSIDNKGKQDLIFSNPGNYKVVFRYESGQFHFVRIEYNGI